MAAFDLKKHTKYLVVHGSRAFGMQRPGSDVDVKGFAFPPISYYLSPLKNNPENGKVGFQQVDAQSTIQAAFFDSLTEEEKSVSISEKVEGIVYDFRKFVRLCLNMNPTMVECLFVRDEEVRITSPVAEALREIAPEFLSTKAKWTYSGYAADQLGRIERHRRWLFEPPTAQPKREDFDLPPGPFMNKSERGALAEVVKIHKDRLANFFGEDFEDENHAFMDDLLNLAQTFCLSEKASFLLQQEKSFEKAMLDWQKYQRWLKDRNPERAELEKKFGYDTKHAAHLVRLLRMGNEVLRTGKINVYRSEDAQELLDIRKGTMSYEELIEYAGRLNRELDDFYRSGQSPLPAKPNLEKIENFCIEWTMREYGL